jgi:hypothetical protein
LYFINKTVVTNLFATILLTWGCSAYGNETLAVVKEKAPSSHVIYYQEDVSRDFTYINFNHNPLPYTQQEQVGGEHIRFIYVLGFAGDKFTVAVTAIGSNIDGYMYDNISGDGVEVTAMESANNGGKDTEKTSLYEVIVINKDALFAVELSAHPYAEYRLVITKL